MEYTDEFKRYIEVLVDFCKHETGHGEYESSLIFMKDSDDDDIDGAHTKMSIVINPVYMYFTIRVYPDCFSHYENKDYEKVGGYVLHEVCHLLTRPIEELFWWDVSASQSKQFSDIIERQVQRIANAIMPGLGDEWYLPEVMQS